MYINKISLTNRAVRMVWGIFWLFFFLPSPRPFHWWRRLLLRLFGAKIGAHVHVYPTARIWLPKNLLMANESGMGPGVDCYNVAPISLGARVVVSQRAFLCTASHDFRSKGFELVAAPIVVNDDVWIAAQAYIGPGVTVGHHAVVGACSVVVKNVHAGDIVVGNPAQSVGSR